MTSHPRPCNLIIQERGEGCSYCTFTPASTNREPEYCTLSGTTHNKFYCYVRLALAPFHAAGSAWALIYAPVVCAYMQVVYTLYCLRYGLFLMSHYTTVQERLYPRHQVSI